MANTDKHFYVNYVSKDEEGDRKPTFTNYAEAEAYAKVRAARDDDGDVYHIYATIATVVGTPPTNVEVTKL